MSGIIKQIRKLLNLQDVLDEDYIGKDGYTLFVNEALGYMELKSNGVGGSSLINQVGIGLAVSVDEIIYIDATGWGLANATDDTKVAIGIVTEIVDDDNIKYQTNSEVPYPTGGLTKGDTYWLSTTDGTATATEPDNYIQPIFNAVETDRILLTMEPMIVYTDDNGFVGIPEAPIDGNQYGREDAAWTIITPSAGGQVDSLVDGLNISIDATDPINPIVNLDGDRIDQEITDAGNISGATTFNMIKSNIDAVLIGDITSISFSNNPISTKRVTIVINITQDGTGNRTITWTGSGVIPKDGFANIDLQPKTAANSITQYWMRWQGTAWTISKIELGGTL